MIDELHPPMYNMAWKKRVGVGHPHANQPGMFCYEDHSVPDTNAISSVPFVSIVPQKSLPTFEDTFEGIAYECLDLLVSKQRSYGPKNVESLGFFGVFDRLSSDKVERLRNAMQGTVKNGKVEITFAETLADESIEDTLKDMVNYALILIALKRGQWGRPLRETK
jgi:hypothetical protein